jgi:hypothetical protein
VQILEAANASGYQLLHTGWQDSLLETCIKRPPLCKRWAAAVLAADRPAWLAAVQSV